MKSFLKKVVFLALISWMTLAILTVSEAGRAAKAKTKDSSPVTVGVPLPLSGNLKEFGTMMRNSFEMAKDSINTMGGINGRLLKMAYVDTQGKDSLAEDVVKKLVIDFKSVMLVGGYSSSPTYVMAKTAQRLDVPFLISTASAELTKSLRRDGRTFSGSTPRSVNTLKGWKIFGSRISSRNPWPLFTKTACSGPMAP
jgi:branched-chain amino acid transport system substrate-binding protein